MYGKSSILTNEIFDYMYINWYIPKHQTFPSNKLLLNDVPTTTEKTWCTQGQLITPSPATIPTSITIQWALYPGYLKETLAHRGAWGGGGMFEVFFQKMEWHVLRNVLALWRMKLSHSKNNWRSLKESWGKQISTFGNSRMRYKMHFIIDTRFVLLIEALT